MVLQAVANDSSSSSVQLTGSIKQALMDRVDAYGDHHTLRCLALASRAMAASNEPVGAPRCSHQQCTAMSGSATPPMTGFTLQAAVRCAADWLLGGALQQHD